MLRTDRTARLEAEVDEAFNRLWEWVKREVRWNAVVICHPCRGQIEVQEVVNPIAHDQEGRALIMRNARARRALRDYDRARRAATQALGEPEIMPIQVNRNGLLHTPRRNCR